ncbi:MAG TPA: DUF1365 domain-containing protein [Chloroflexota bacterium]|nr:DUF1365 domain-containing protein [Chloroflexota bacterium]
MTSVATAATVSAETTERAAAATPLASALYVGRVVHQRFRPREHRFAYPIYMHLLDLDEVPGLGSRVRLFGHNRARPVVFRERDHFGDPARTLRENALDFLRAHGHRGEIGAIRLLTQCRVAGYVFNPVSFYYCHAPTGEVSAVIAEVHNTFGETHPYLLTGDGPGVLSGAEKKVFHVSPFMTLEGTYHFRLTVPGEALSVGIDLQRGGERLFASALTLRRRELSDRALLALLLRYPMTPLRVSASIYWEALHLWRKRISFHPKPPYDPDAARETAA